MNKYELYYQVAQAQASEQQTRKHQIEFRASAALGLGATVLGLAGLTVTTWSDVLIIPAILIVALFLLEARFALLALDINKFHKSPPLSVLYNHLGDPEYSDEGLISWAGASISEAVGNNDELLGKKARHLHWSLRLLLVESTMLGVIFFVSKV